MLKICGESICRPFNIILKHVCIQVSFFWNGKKANIVPIHKKYDKQTVKNYHPVSILLICDEIFERLLYNEMINFF